MYTTGQGREIAAMQYINASLDADTVLRDILKSAS